MFYVFHLGTPPISSTKTSVERKTDTEVQTTAVNVKTTEGVHIIVEKETSPTHTSKPTEPTPTPKKQDTKTKISATPVSTEKTPFIVKVEVEQEQKTSGAEKKLQEEDKGKSEGVVVVQKVTEEEEEKEQTAEEPKSIKVVKVANDETGWDEEADLESGKTGEKEKPKERVGNAAVTTPVKTEEIGITVVKITSSPKSPTKSTQSEVLKVERVSSKQSVETKRSFVERIEEDEDLKVGAGEAQSPDGEEKIEVTVEKESTETSPAKESSSAKEIVIGVERVSPATDETDEEVKKVEVIAKPTTTKELPISQGNVDKVSISVEKITPSPKSPTKSTQSEVVKVERVSSKQSVETKRNFVERIEEDEDLNVGAGEAQSPDGEETIEVTVEKESTETSPAKESSSAKEIIVEVKKVSPATDKTDEETKPTVKPTTTKELPISQGNVEKVSISVEKITPSQSPTSGKPQTSMVRKVVKVTTTEEEDLETSQDAVNYKRSDDASEKTSSSEEEALELELEGGQEKMNTEKDKVDEQKLAEEFDKALEAERNGKGDGIDKQLEKLNVEAAPEKVEVRKVMSDEERELAELAEETINDEGKEEVKPTKNPTTATAQEVVTKVEKVSKVTVQVTKEQTVKLPLREEETAKEEKKLKVELENELQQEKEEVSIRV